MLDSFRRRDNSRAARYQSPYGELQDALTPAQAEATQAEAKAKEPAAKPDVQTMETYAQGTMQTSATQAVSKLIVGPDIKLKGAEITDCDTLVVEGRVEASMDSRVIQIAENGVFIGKVGIDIAEIRGRFDGELTARKQLVIRATGRVSGKIRYGKVAIEEGGELSGDIGALPGETAATAAQPLFPKSANAKH
jgi:cytoskeletal protein CcmA (bactofilin family)